MPRSQPAPSVQQHAYDSVPTHLERFGAASCAPPPRSRQGGYFFCVNLRSCLNDEIFSGVRSLNCAGPGTAPNLIPESPE
eukprot:8387798-Alexandrium_andersonii.AAC.1